VRLEATVAKTVAAENIFQACDLGMQVLGGLGYTLDSDLNRYWRRVRLFRLAPISSEMALNFVAESFGLRGASDGGRGEDVMTERLDGKVVIVTGAGQGIGRVYAAALAAEGASVVVADVNEAGPRRSRLSFPARLPSLST